MPEDQGIPIGASVDTVEAYLGGGSSVILSASVTLTDADVNAANSQANGVAVVPAPDAGTIICPLAVILAVSVPDGTGDAKIAAGYGAAGSPVSFGSLSNPADVPYFWSAGASLAIAPVNVNFAVVADAATEFRVFATGGAVDVPSGPYIITVLYTLVALP